MAEASNETTFVLKIKSTEAPDPLLITKQASFAAIALHRMFGADRFEIWHEGKRFVFDPLAQDGEHYGHDEVSSWIQPKELNGKEPNTTS